MMMKKIALVLVPSILVVAFVVYIVQRSGPTPSTAQKQTFVYCSEGSPTNFGPPLVTDSVSGTAIDAIYERLTAFEYGETTIIPSLAESWTISSNQLTYTFQLRQGVSFHSTPYFTPTRDFNADDVLFSIDRQRLTDHPYHTVGGGQYVYFNSMSMGDIIQGVEKIDDYTIAITLSKPNAPFLANLAMTFMSIYSKEYADKLIEEGKLEDIDHFPIGTGPFVFNRYIQDNTIRFEANPRYWEEGLPRIQNLVFAITPDANVRFQKLKSGECHYVTQPAPPDLDAMRADPNIRLSSIPGLNVGYLAMNVEKEPFGNPLVRQAVHHALNRENYIEAIYLNNASVAKNPIPPTMWSYNDAVEDYPYSVERAQALLAEAGLANGFETDLWTLPVTRPYNPNGRRMGEMMQADLAAVGIRVNLVTYDWPTYLERSNRGEHSMIQLGWIGDNGDPDNFLNTLLGCSAVEPGNNLARWCHREFNDLVTRAMESTDLSERTSLYRSAQEIFKREAPWVSLAHSIVFRAMSTRVQNHKINPVPPADSFKYVELE